MVLETGKSKAMIPASAHMQGLLAISKQCKDVWSNNVMDEALVAQA